MTVLRTYHLGRLPVELRCNDPFTAALDEEWTLIATAAPSPDDAGRGFIIESAMALPPLSKTALLQPMRVDAQHFRHGAGRYGYQATRSGDNLRSTSAPKSRDPSATSSPSSFSA